MPAGGSELSEFQKRRRLKHTASPVDISTGWNLFQLRLAVLLQALFSQYKKQNVLPGYGADSYAPNEDENAQKGYQISCCSIQNIAIGIRTTKHIWYSVDFLYISQLKDWR